MSVYPFVNIFRTGQKKLKMLRHIFSEMRQAVSLMLMPLRAKPGSEERNIGYYLIFFQ